MLSSMVEERQDINALKCGKTLNVYPNDCFYFGLPLACFGFAGLRKVMVRAHRQAWCWQDEWYGLTIEDIRQLEKEAQLMLAQKMAKFSFNENETEQHLPKDPLGDSEMETKAISPSAEAGDAASNIGEALPGRVLTKQWSTSSKSSSKRGGELHST